MPIGKKTTGDNTLYALIAFVLLFVIATTAAIIFYLRFEDQRALADMAQKRLDEVANQSEIQRIGTLVGSAQSGKSRLRAMLDYLDQSISLIVPGLPTESSAEVKVQEASAKVRGVVVGLSKQFPDFNNLDPNASLLQVSDKLTAALKIASNAEKAAKEQLDTLQKRFDDAMKASVDKEKVLLEEKEKFQKQYETARAGYDELKGLLEKKTEAQVKDLYSKLEQERSDREELNKQLLRTQAELKLADERIKEILRESVYPLKPPPDAEVKAFEPDGKVIVIDNQNKIVHINLGQNDHIYRGLTFSVYDKGQPIPKTGKGKAEIEIFSIDDTISQARIIRSEPKNPIVVDDIIANVIWDAKKVNTFVIVGDFDLNGNGTADADAVEKLIALVEKWGGKVSDTMTVNTDFVVLGSTPEIPPKPTLEETSIYPDAMEKYEKALERQAKYTRIQSQAQALSIPILNLERFLYFVGYKTMSGRPGVF
ncbi:MAG: hypothetical protein JW749_11055 [Sedimentisphaerales bacterium]|nr:hypothetical protein [Sedimentisphaerales bacterium]